MTIRDLLEDVHENRLALAALLLGAIVATAAVYFILPVADGIIFGVFFFFVTRPVKEFFDRYTKYSPYLTALCVLLPLAALVAYALFGIWGEARWLVEHGAELDDMLAGALAGLNLPFGLDAALDTALKSLYNYALTYLGTIPIGGTVSRVISLAMNALISLFVCFYLLKDGGSFIESMRGLVPARQRPVADTFLAEADRLLSGIYTGTFYTALFVAAGAFVIFVLFGIPYKALLTAFVFIAAMVPILSGMMVFIPIAIYMYVYRSPLVAALFLGTAVIFVYLPPDFIIRPYLINKASDLHPLLIILAFIGGGVAGGLSGFFAAPLAVGLATALYRTYLKTKGKDDESIH